jgi:thiol-disulfide isomerase/thioredoxin
MEKKKTTRHSPGFIYAMIMVGVGFILLGIVLYFILDARKVIAQNDEFSTTPVKVNYPAPELTLTNLEGTSVSLKDYLGSVVLVNMWATWCPPCKAEMPTLQAFYDEYKDRGFEIIAINDGDTIDLVKPFVQEYELTFPVWLDEEYLSEKAFNTQRWDCATNVGRSHQRQSP